MADTSVLLKMLKCDIPISSDAYDERLSQYIEASKEAITEEGINLTDSIHDADLIVMYALWRWKKRTTGEAMPKMLRVALNDRLFSQKMKENNDV